MMILAENVSDEMNHTEIMKSVDPRAQSIYSTRYGLNYPHSVESEGFNASDIRGLRDQICSAFGPKVNCVRQVDF